MLLNESSEILIRNGKVVNDDYTFISDVLIKDGKIIDISKNIEAKDNFVIIDANDHYIFPGGIDLNTNFQINSSADDFNTGCLSSLYGGTTTIVDKVEMVGSETLITTFNRVVGYANRQKYCNVLLKICVQNWSQEIENDFDTLIKENGVYMLSIRAGQIADESLIKLMLKCKQVGGVLHISGCDSPIYKMLENEIIKEGITGPEGYLYSHPEEIELSLIGKTVLMAHTVGVPVYVASITSYKVADLIVRFRKQGVVVFGETTGYALTIGGSKIYDESWEVAASVLVDPPLRTCPKTIPTLCNHLASSGLQFVSSNHAAFKMEQKALGKDDFRKIVPGLAGAQERNSIIWEKLFETAKIDLTQYVSLTSSNAAKLLNLFPNKGKIMVGSDADLIIYPLGKSDAKSVRATNCDVDEYSRFLNRVHNPAVVIVGGKIILNENKVSEIADDKNMILTTRCFPEFVYGRLISRKKKKVPTATLR